jgi:hypothetical protein
MSYKKVIDIYAAVRRLLRNSCVFRGEVWCKSLR